MSELTLAQGPDDRPALHVVFKVAGTEYALPVDVVVQMESFSGATAIPSARPFVAGVMQLRGRVVPVIDLRVRFGLPPVAADLDTRVVVGQHGSRVVALRVDSAREVVRISPGQQAPPPRVVSDGAGGFVRALAQVADRLLLVLDFGKVIGEEEIDG